MPENHPISLLRCRACGHTTEPLGVQYCDRCFGPLDLVDPDPTDPAEAAFAPARTATPLRAVPDLGGALGIDDLWVKDETANVTGSFKDRVVAAAADRAVALGVHTLACSSTGNLARALVVGARARGLRPVVLVPSGTPDVATLVDHGATVVVVDGDYDAVNRVAAMSDDLPGWAWVNGDLRPWYSAGAAQVGVELAGSGPIDRLVLPMASGALALQAHRALVAHRPGVALVVGQPAGCAPVAAAFTAGAADVAPVRPATRVGVLAMGDPPDGPDVLAAARADGGAVVAVAEDDLDDLLALLADTTGVEGDLASAVALGAARATAGPGRTVVVLTGGLARWPAAPVGGAGVAVTIAPSSAALRDAVGEEHP